MTLTVPPADAEHAFIISTEIAIGPIGRSLGSSNSSPTSTAWPANNQAYLIPFVLSTPMTFVEMFILSGNSPGTTQYDLGVYNDQFIKLASTGAVSMVNSSQTIQPAGGAALTSVLTLNRGRYFLAMSAASTGLTVASTTLINQVPRALGMYTMATAHPLPSTFVPASMGTATLCPSIYLSTLTNPL